MVIPRSRSRSMLSRNWSFCSRWGRAPVYSISRSARVDLPWSIWAMMEKLRISLVGVGTSLTFLAGDRTSAVGLSAYHVESQLAWKMRLFPLQDQIDSLANIFRDRHLGLLVQELELFVLFRGDVHGGRDLVPCHGKTMHDHMSIVNPVSFGSPRRTSRNRQNGAMTTRTCRNRPVGLA